MPKVDVKDSFAPVSRAKTCKNLLAILFKNKQQELIK